jgi:LysR family hydrogen peroxide-inducible transcriptional activator
MTLQDLRYLVALFDCEHFGRAAHACGVTQPTLSMQIKKLEDQLGVTLVERSNKKVHVTSLGAEVVARARQILLEVEAIVDVGRHNSAPLSGAFSLGVIPTLGPYLLPWLVPALKKDFPELRLTIHEDVTDSLVDRLVSNRLDAALVAVPISDDRTDSLPLFDEPFWFAEPKTSRPANVEVMTEGELRGRKLLLLTEGHCLRDQALAICRSSESDDEGDFRATSLETIRQMVATGMGSTLLPAMACSDFRSTGLTARPLESGIGRRIGLIWRRRYPRAADLQLFAQTLQSHLPEGVRSVPRQS